jgi:capsular polysaccharide biosynthesis protein
MSRSRQPARKLTNETEIEDLFRSFGFSILYPETLSIEEQVASVSMAELIAGPSGSAMFNLAFHKRLKSVFMIVPETFIQISEWLFLAGTSCPMYYHVGSLSTAVDGISARRDSWEVNVQRLASDVAMWLSQIGTTQ